MNELEKRQELKTDFPFYAENVLKIRTKEGSIIPFKLNKAQLYLHGKIEHQKASTGKVRIIIVKGRQQGCSTYVAGRFYHQTSHKRGVKCFILTHRDDATLNLYNLVKRYHSNCPKQVKPHTGTANAKALNFDVLDSGYGVGTAGGGTVGRSDTIQLFHGSEVAYWENTEDISGGIMQAIPDMKNTEVILESTANGIGNMFHKMAIDATKGTNGYELVFIPWFWQEEYRTDKEPEDFEITQEERLLVKAYKLDNRQLVWRRLKIKQFIGGILQFNREYPNNYTEAFQTSSEDSLIQPHTILTARVAENVRIDDDLIIGVDPAYKGSDDTAIVFRSGRVQWKHERHHGLDTMQVVGRLVQIINHFKPTKVFVDIGGIGAGIYDRLKELGYGRVVMGVNFGGAADKPESFKNKRAEMWGRMHEWLKSQPVKIEDDDDLHADLLISDYEITSLGQLKLKPKDWLKKKYHKSPDLGDGLSLTFAFLLPNKKLRERYGIGMTKTNKTWSVYG